MVCLTGFVTPSHCRAAPRCRTKGLPKVVSIQNVYSLLNRSAYETDLAECCAPRREAGRGGAKGGGAVQRWVGVLFRHCMAPCAHLLERASAVADLAGTATWGSLRTARCRAGRFLGSMSGAQRRTAPASLSSRHAVLGGRQRA